MGYLTDGKGMNLEQYKILEKAGFESKYSRDEFRKIIRNLVRYAHDNKIKNMVLLDTAARPGALAFIKEWRNEYSSEKRPDIYFINPRVHHKSDEILVTEKGLDEGNIGRVREEISLTEFRSSYKKLIKNKDKPTLIFDACSHTGATMSQTYILFGNEGFSDIKIGLAYEERTKHRYTGTDKKRADFVGSENLDESNCHPFGWETAVEKGGSITSRRTTRKESLRNARQLREAISRIMDSDL
ncbi:MAG: hypothetical protein NTX24_00655 [Candidatus Pacearchaeota archaeon]|nr:hypothetical protein [Candidatus Pacearchaeota archaeon]